MTTITVALVLSYLIGFTGGPPDGQHGTPAGPPAGAENVPATETMTVPAVADTWVSGLEQGENFGRRTYLTVRGAQESGLVRFDIPAAPGWRVSAAQLRLNSGRVPGRAVSVYTTSGSWVENQVTWQNAPEGDGLLGTSGDFGTFTWVTWNVLPAVPPAGGSVSLRLENPSGTWMGFATRESGPATAPQLVVTLSRTSEPVPAVTSPVPLPLWTPPAVSATRSGPTPAVTPSAGTATGSDPADPDARASGQGPHAAPGWRRTFFDDFGGTGLGPGWGTYLGSIPSMPGGTWASDQVRVQDGKLRLLSSRTDGRWTSGGVGNASQGRSTYGKYEVRFRMDRAPGVKYALLLWPASNRWPMDGEIDFAEDAGGNRSGTSGTVIWGASAGQRQQLQKQVRADFSRWHTVGAEWTPGKVVFTLDGKPYGTVTSTHVPSTPMNLALQTEAGSCGQWMSCADSTTPAVTALEVDWVAVYAKA